MSFTKFKDMLENITSIRNTYKGTEEELMNETVHVGTTFSSSPHYHVAITGSFQPIAYVSNEYISK